METVETPLNLPLQGMMILSPCDTQHNNEPDQNKTGGQHTHQIIIHC
jgi:hypothetical protein